MEAADAGGEASAALDGDNLDLGDEGGGDDSPLLAVPPGSRNSPRLTPGAKGKVYHPKKVDRRNAGARSRHFAAQRDSERSSRAGRNIFPGNEITGLAKSIGANAGIYAENDTTYNKADREEEKKLFEVTNSVRELLDSLDKKSNILLEQTNED